MNPNKVKRNRLLTLTDLPNIGPALAELLRTIDVHAVSDLVGRDPFAMYDTLCKTTATRQDR